MKKKKKAAKRPTAQTKKVKVKAKAKKAAPKAKKAAKKTTKKVARKKPAEQTQARPKVIAPVNGVLLGLVEDYFAKVGVIALTLKGAVAIGQRIQVLGHTTHIEQSVDSMQIDHQAVSQANAGEGVGIKVVDRARRGDHVFLLR